MSSKINFPNIRKSTVLLLIFVVMAAGLAVARQPGVVPPGLSPLGVSYTEWSVAWWQWVFSLPQTGHPLFSSGWVDCSYGQFSTGQLGSYGFTRPVWFLVGSLSSGSTTRTCKVPAETWLFVPVLNAWSDNVAVVPPVSVDQVRQYAAYYADARELHASVDGVPVYALKEYRAAYAPFGYTVPKQNNMVQYFGADAPGKDWPTTYIFPAATDGYWLMLEPLPSGKHVINFGGTVRNTGFQIDITYYITIQ